MSECGSLAPAARRPLRVQGKPRAATRPRPCVSRAPGSLSISLLCRVVAPRDSAPEGAGRGEAAPPGLAAAPPRLTRPVAAHALQVAAPGGGPVCCAAGDPRCQQEALR